jgi:hypothetical protein
VSACIALTVGAPLGRMLGYQATIPRLPERRAGTARTYDRGWPHSPLARGPER